MSHSLDSSHPLHNPYSSSLYDSSQPAGSEEEHFPQQGLGPRDPRLEIIPMLGPTFCEYYLHCAICIPIGT